MLNSQIQLSIKSGQLLKNKKKLSGVYFITVPTGYTWSVVILMLCQLLLLLALMLEADHWYLGAEMTKLWMHESLCSTAAATREICALHIFTALSAG